MKKIFLLILLLPLTTFAVAFPDNRSLVPLPENVYPAQNSINTTIPADPIALEQQVEQEEIVEEPTEESKRSPLIYIAIVLLALFIGISITRRILWNRATTTPKDY